MSSLLDEAIVDAKALREAVLKNAEASLLEAYAPKIEETVARLLEQDPAGGLGLPMDIGSPPADIGAPPGDLGVAPEPEDAETPATFPEEKKEDIPNVKYAATTELDDDSSLEDEVEIDVTRGELQEMLESITRDIEALEEEMEEERLEEDRTYRTEKRAKENCGDAGYRKRPSDGLYVCGRTLEEQVEIDEDILEAFELDEEHCYNKDEELEEELVGDQEELDANEDGKITGKDFEMLRKKTRKHNESLEITEDNIADIVESLVVDIMPTKSGWAGTPESVMQHNEELAAAMAQSDKYKEEKEELLKVGQSLRESLEKHQTVNAKLKEVVDALKEKLDEVNLTNAKLLYTNRILRKSSLNERQKNKIVEALSNAGSVNEAKVLYETLQNAVGSSRKEGPQSLSEAVSRPSTMLPRRKVQDNDSNSFTDRMKMLAGIKN